MFLLNLLIAVAIFFAGFYAMALIIASFIIEKSETEVLEKVRELKRNAIQGENK